MSVFAKMKTDPRMKKTVKRAVMSTPDQQKRNEDFPGPDGDYTFVWTKLREWDKNGTSYAVFEFVCEDEGEGSESAEGFPMSMLIAFEDSANMTLDDKLEQFFETLQLLGVDTPTLQSPDAIEKASREAVAERRRIVGSVTTSKDKKYRNIRIKELLDEVAESVEETPEVEEVEEVTTPSDTVEETESDNPYLADPPSSWEGYQATVSDPDDEDVYWIANCDDEAGTVDLTDDDENVIYEAAEWTLIIPQAE